MQPQALPCQGPEPHGAPSSWPPMPPTFSGPSTLAWLPVHSLRAWLAAAGRACTDACLDHGLVCEPSFFPLLNSQDAFQK